MTDRELMQQALEALESAKYGMAECRQEIGFDFANEQYDVEQAITALRERLADNTIHSCSYYCERPDCVRAQRDELRERLAQPEQDVWQWEEIYKDNVLIERRMKRGPDCGWEPWHTPRREWVGLTDEDMAMCESEEDVRFVRAIEAKLKEKNA